MRSASWEDLSVDGSGDYTGEAVPCDLLTSASVIATVTDSSSVVGTLELYGSNEAPPSYIRQTQFTPASDNWSLLASAAVTGDGAVRLNANLAYRYVRVVFDNTSGSATLAIRLSLKGPDVEDGDTAVAYAIEETSGPDTLVVGAIEDGQVLVRSGDTLVGSDAATMNETGVDAPPSEPDADDIEFDANADPFSGWSDASSTLTTVEAGDPDPTVTVASTNYRFSSTVRPGWGVFQYGKNGGSAGLYARTKLRTFGTDEVIVLNLDIAFPNATPTINSPGIAFDLSQSTGGGRDVSNRVYVYLNSNDGGVKQIVAYKVVGGVSTVAFTAVAYGTAPMPRRISHVAVYKKSTTYYFYVRGGDTGWVYLGTTTAAITPDRMNIDIFGDTGTLPGSPVVAFRYLRFLPSFPV